MKRIQQELQRPDFNDKEAAEATGIDVERLVDIAKYGNCFPYERQELSSYLKIPIYELDVMLNGANPLPTKQPEPKEGEDMGKTRRKFTDLEKRAIVREAKDNGNVNTAKKHNIHTSLLYKWRNAYSTIECKGDGGGKALADVQPKQLRSAAPPERKPAVIHDDDTINATIKTIEGLKAQNRELKLMYADAELERRQLKEQLEA